MNQTTKNNLNKEKYQLQKQVMYADGLLITDKNINTATKRLSCQKILVEQGSKVNLERTKYAKPNFTNKHPPIVKA